jgi:hypothetical protein
MSGETSPWPSGGLPPVNAFDPDLQVRRADYDDDGWAVWTYDGGDVQRAVVHFRGRAPGDVASGYRVGSHEASQGVEQALRKQLKRFMARRPEAGMAFGAILEIPAPLLDMPALLSMVDRYEDATGSLQWIVQSGLSKRRVQAARTWAHGYLTKTYSALLRQYDKLGFAVTSERKPRRR